MGLFSKIREWHKAQEKKKEEEFFQKAIEKIYLIQPKEMGFTIQSVGSKQCKEVAWVDVKNIYYRGQQLTVETNTESISIPEKNHVGWHEFLSVIPKGFSGFDYAFVENFFNSLEACKICGIVAVMQNKCLSCLNQTWNDEMKTAFPSEMDYLKESQLYLFEAEENESIVIDNTTNGVFTPDPNWKPLVTEKEVDDFHKEE